MIFRVAKPSRYVISIFIIKFYCFAHLFFVNMQSIACKQCIRQLTFSKLFARLPLLESKKTAFMVRSIIFAIALAWGIISCSPSAKKQGLHFTFLDPFETGVDFKNDITESDSLNLFVNEYTYMGGGIGIGDFNNDGLPDIFFAGNQVSSRLYVNKGSMHFEDITRQAGVATDRWCTGVSVIDINNDGWLDIYVCVSGRVDGSKRKNLLFVNQHNLTFKEVAEDYNLDDSAYSTQAVFFDYDKDGKLDMYLLNHTLNNEHPNDIRDTTVDVNSIAGDKLFHNEGMSQAAGHPVYKDVTHQAGIREDGNGLGVIVSDLNGDNYPDIYVCNDYIHNDLLWLNNKNGTFSNCIASAVKHQSYSSMGTDAADINNDGLPDIISLDMQPETNYRKKMMFSFLNEQRRQLEDLKGYQKQYVHNMLQLNNGTRHINNRDEPFFSEIGYMAGIAETDWSWSVLITDLDNDGWKDVHITNGLGRDATNVDFVEYMHDVAMKTGISYFDRNQQKSFNERLKSMGPLSLRNYLYKNNGNLTFDDVSKSAGIEQLSVSNGAAYADLDNDGDVDIVCNNINSSAFVMRNDVRNSVDTSKNSNYLSIQLLGDSLNKEGIGARVLAYSKGLVQTTEQYPVRGYLSSVDNRLHFGFNSGAVDSLKVCWPDGKVQLINKPAINSQVVVSYNTGLLNMNAPRPMHDSLFYDVTQQLNLNFQHEETYFYDYEFQPLILQKYSQEGPFISTGDVNGDRLQDFFIGGAYKQTGRLFIQQPDGSFKGQHLVTGVKNEEDMQSAFFDADGDGDLDLIVLGGSTEFRANSPMLHPRLYTNDGKGGFTINTNAVPAEVRTPAKALAIGDFDGDGDLDIFIGGRVSIGLNPQTPRSYLLRNDKGKFTDITHSFCPALENAQMINAALWADIDQDGKPELIVAADLMPIRIFKNTGNTLTEITAKCNLSSASGFWRSISIADVDNDGDMDIVAGNIGLNNPYHIAADQPAELAIKDFDDNGIVEPVFCYYIKSQDDFYNLSAGVSRDELARQMPSIKKRYEHNDLFAKANMNEIFDDQLMQGAKLLKCNEAESGYFENNGKAVFTFHPFPVMAQEAPVNAITCTDINGDGLLDIIIGGNEYASKVSVGRLDASYGLTLMGKGRGKFKVAPPAATGLILDGDTRDVKLLPGVKGKLLLVAINNSPMKAFSLNFK